jgi:hypothetical protein
MNPNDLNNSRRDAMNPFYNRSRDILFNPISVSVIGDPMVYPSFPEILPRSTMENAQLPQLWRHGSNSRGQLSEFSADLTTWQKLVKWYDLMWGDPNPGTPAPGMTVLTSPQSATYADWIAAFDACKSQDCVEKIKNLIVTTMMEYAYSAGPLTEAQYAELLAYQPNLFWNNNKWYVIGGGSLLLLFVGLGIMKKVAK